jgi:hypothetical protein
MQHSAASWKVSASRAHGHRVLALRSSRVSFLAQSEATVRNTYISSAVVIGAWLLVPAIASAQAGPTASAQSSSASPLATPSSSSNPWSTGTKDKQKEANKRHLAIGLSGGGFITPRWEVKNGGVLELEILWRFRVQPRHRFEVGVEGRFVGTGDTTHVGVGVPLRFVFGMSELLEMDFTMALSYTRLLFEQPFFVPRNAFTARLGWGFGFLVAPSLSVGATPLGFAFMAGERVEPFVAYEPSLWVRFAPF